MKRRIACCVLVALVAGLAPGAAWSDEDEDDEPGGCCADWLAETGNNLGTGLNGVITFLADPVMDVVEPPKPLAELPAGAVTGRILGFPAGILRGLWRATSGIIDFVFAPLPHTVMSPEPRFSVVPGFEYDGY